AEEFNRLRQQYPNDAERDQNRNGGRQPQQAFDNFLLYSQGAFDWSAGIAFVFVGYTCAGCFRVLLLIGRSATYRKLLELLLLLFVKVIWQADVTNFLT